MKQIHRFGLGARALCGATGKLLFTTSGVVLTCPECMKRDMPAISVQEWLALRDAENRITGQTA